MLATINRKAVLLIVGPTGVGKTSQAIELAKLINGEIISADSRYLYRGMDIGTAKPTAEQIASVSHHLIDIAEPNEIWSLAKYLERTQELIDEIHNRNSIPIITGGTGQYVRALTEGWKIPELDADQNLRGILINWGEIIGAQRLHEKLRIIDEAAAGFIDASNMRRTIRALEVIFATGKKFSDLRRKEGPAHKYWIIGLNLEREELYKRIDTRIDEMIIEGLENEVRNLLAKGFSADLPAMTAIGYREMVSFIYGEIDLETAKAIMRRNTRNLVRRQANWFKSSNPEIHWYKVSNNTSRQILNDLSGTGILE